jgi:hypothetical protein
MTVYGRSEFEILERNIINSPKYDIFSFRMGNGGK